MTQDFKDIGPSEFSLGPEGGRPRRAEGGRKAKSLVIALVILACVGSLLFGISRAAPLVRKAISGSPYFRLEGVDVIGVKNADPSEIADAIGFSAGTRIFETDLAAVRGRVASVDWVRDARVDRKLPNRLVVTVVEHTPVGVTVTDEGYRFVDPDGDLAEIDAEVKGYPIFIGMKTKREFADGTRLTLTLYEKKIVAAGFLGSVRYDAAMGYTVVTQKGVRLIFGQPPFEKKIERLVAVLPDAERRGPIEYIYLNIEGRIVVKNKTPMM